MTKFNTCHTTKFCVDLMVILHSGLDLAIVALSVDQKLI